MDRGTNLVTILAFEKQIEEHERAAIRLKRARNSLLNVTTLLPPEILGKFFHWNVINSFRTETLAGCRRTRTTPPPRLSPLVRGCLVPLSFGASGAILHGIGRVDTLVV